MNNENTSCYWDGSQVCGTLTSHNANGAQRMPDKENFNCVIVGGVYPEKAGSLCASGYNKLGTQEAMNDMFVVEKTICLETFHCTTEEDRTQPLKARDYKDPLVIAIDRAAFNQGENAKYDFDVSGGGYAQTLMARGPGAVCCPISEPSEHYATEIGKE